ncbi:hypothetical protein [Mastigocoleus testarum]|uniref:DUF2157 domain-containing protein n=1 Tax=Mastigocoleus testarum BC008 TaxID=371196 RepID=A0A0V7ZW23_9CYAN|nr:hypothetical protein [Mastigocoleus testarum]KST68730.1 hypothetical protein BC008_01880 [Mastigocoleus testarum BC008]KST68742.1 hypothetical protein BC008_01940 [Mastigocoleus testarum BC008]
MRSQFERPNSPNNLEIILPRNHPELLSGLDSLLKLGLISDSQVKHICREFLVCQAILRTQNQKTSDKSVKVSQTLATKAHSDPTEASQSLAAPNIFAAMLQSLLAELSVRWLLFLGMFLVVISSGVLAASQWGKFPASGQYGVLWAYTLTFWGASFWAGRQPNLRLTAGTLLTITLLLIPINFWAIDSFGLWNNPLEWTVIAIAAISLTIITNLLCNHRLFAGHLPVGKLYLVNVLALSYLHWGWKIPGIPLIAVYIATIGTTIATIIQAFNRKIFIPLQAEDKKSFLGMGLIVAVVIYSLLVLLARAIFVVRIDPTQLGLAIGICGWLINWLTLRPQTKVNKSSTLPTLNISWQLIGSTLLIGSWLLTVTNQPQQAIAISGLGLWLFNRRLRIYSLKFDLGAIFIIGLQTVWLGWRLIPAELQTTLISTATQITSSISQPWSLLSVTLFPYIIFMVAFANRLYKREKLELAEFGEQLTFNLGVVLTITSILNPTLRFLNLLLSSITLGVVTCKHSFRSKQNKQNHRTNKKNINLVYLTHITGILALSAGINLFLPNLSKEYWVVILLVLMVAEWFCSIGEGIWRRSAWYVGLGLAAESFVLLSVDILAQWYGLEVNSGNWGLIWLVTPIALTINATRYNKLGHNDSERNTNALLGTIALFVAQLLTLPLHGTRLVGLGVGVGLMFINTNYLRKKKFAVITVGFILASFASMLWEILAKSKSLVEAWFLAGALIILCLWVVRRLLASQENHLAAIYTDATDKWGMVLCGTEIFLLCIHTLLVYLGQTETKFMYPFAIAINMGALAFRSWDAPSNWTFYGIAWSLELFIAQILGFGETSLVKITVANIALGLIIQLFGEWWRQKHQLRTLPQRWHILPLVYGSFGLLLRYQTFENWTGLSSLAVALIFIGVGRRTQKLKPLLYLGIIGVSLAGYELLLYQISQASGEAYGDALIAMSALGTTIMYGYRVLSPWLKNYLCLTLVELQTISHFHWAWSSFLLISSLSAPIEQQMLGFGVGVFLVRYAIFQGRIDPNSQPIWNNIKGEEIWVYLGFLQAGFISIFLWNTPIGKIFNGILIPWQAAIFCLLAYFVYILPWENWGWSKKPWKNLAYVLPLIIIYLTKFDISPVTLLIVASYYIFLTIIKVNFRISYVSLVLVNWAIWRLFLTLNFVDPLWYVSLIGFSLLYIAQFDPQLQKIESKEKKHYLRLLGTCIVCGWAAIFNQNVAFIPGILSIVAIFAGLALRVRAFLYVGTTTFLMTTIYQFVVLIYNYPFTKWVIGLFIGIILILIAANFENHRNKISSLIRNTSDEFKEWN